MRIGEFEINEPLPNLDNPHVLAVLKPWIDVGNVGSLTLSRIERYARARELGRLARPSRFYDFTRYRPRSYFNEGRREYNIPNTIIRYALRQEGPNLVLIHMLEPHLYGEDFTESMMELLKFLGAKRYSLIGAMYDMVPHTRPLLVSGSAQGPNADIETEMVRVHTSTYEGPTTINYLVTQQAAEQGIETRTFVVHLPQYFQVDEDFNGVARLMEVLCQLYHLPGRLIDRERGNQQYASLENMVNDSQDVKSLLSRLEERYDREQRSNEPKPPPLSPNIEEFLREIDRGFDSPSS